MSNFTPHIPPLAVCFGIGDTYGRRADTLDRRKFMEGGWPSFVRMAMAQLLTDQAVQSMACLDVSRNIFRDTIVRIATRYHDQPSVKEGELDELDAAALFSEHQTVEQYALAYNVAAVAMRISEGEMIVDVLPPDHCDTIRDIAGRTVKLRLARPYNVSGTMADFSIEEWDISDPKKPLYSVYDKGQWAIQPEYPWRFADGEPFIPAVLYRIGRMPDWWGANRWPELIEGTVEENIAWTIHRYARLNAGNGLPYSMDAVPMGQSTEVDAEGNKVETSASTLLQLISVSGKQGSLGTLAPTFDAEKDVQAIVASYNSRMGSLGIGDTALQRGGAESGYAIVVRREGLERLRQSTETAFRKADREYLRKCVALMRIFAGGKAESSKYRIEYAPLSMGSVENKELREQEKHDLDIGVATPASILAAREGISLDDATERLVLLGLLKPATEAISTPQGGPTPEPPPPVPPADPVAAQVGP